MFTQRRTTRREESRVREKKEKVYALSLTANNRRSPAIDLRTVDDVPTAACVEMARAIMRTPDIRTGSLFKLVAASRNEVNKSDAVIVIASAILKSIGNDVAADKILSRSKTVSEFYTTMSLDDDRVRDSFCVLLFAIAPEFVKMVESALTTALNKVKEMTDAPHASKKLLDATHELAKEGDINMNEHSRMLEDFSPLKLGKDEGVRPMSIQMSPTDGVSFDDSISQAAKSNIFKDTSPIDSRGIMRHIKDNRATPASDYYANFPDGFQAVTSKNVKGRTGLGYKPAASAFSDDMSESAMTSAMNQLLIPRSNPKTRKRLDSLGPFTNERIEFVKSTQSTVTDSMFNKPPDVLNYHVADFAVTMDDIAQRKTEMGGQFELGSKIDTAVDDDDESLLGLL